MLRTHYVNILTVLVLLLNSSLLHSAEQQHGLEIAIAPFLPVKTLISNYAPLREYLQNKLGVPVTIISAPDFKTYFKRMQAHEYAIVITIPSAAYMAYTDYGYIPLLRPINYTRAALIVTKEQPPIQPADLRGKTIAIPDAMTITSMMGMQMLQNANLEPGRNVFIKNVPNHSAAVNHVIAGEVTAAIVSDSTLLQIPAASRDKIKTTYTWDKEAVPGIIYMGNPDIPSARLNKISNAILEFSQHTEEGSKLMKDMGYGGLKTISVDELLPLATYSTRLKNLLSKMP